MSTRPMRASLGVCSVMRLLVPAYVSLDYSNRTLDTPSFGAKCQSLASGTITISVTTALSLTSHPWRKY